MNENCPADSPFTSMLSDYGFAVGSHHYILTMPDYRTRRPVAYTE